MSTIEYIFDPRFECAGLGIKVYGNSPRFGGSLTGIRWFLEILKIECGANFEKCTIVVANDKFDISILYHHFNIDPPYVVDIQHLDRHVEARASHKVKDMAERWGTQRKGTGLEKISGKHWDDLDSDIQEGLKEYTYRDVEVEEELFTILLPLLTRPEIELPLARLTLDMFLKPRFRVDKDKARNLWSQSSRDLKAAIGKTGYDRDTISGNISFEKLLREALGDEKPPMKQGKNGPILAMSKTDEGRGYLLTHPNPVVRTLVAARVEIRSTPLHQARIANLVHQSEPLGGYLPVPLTSNSAHTGRWAGGERINLQNLPPDLKLLLIAPEGRTIVQADQAQIEARLLAYFAGQEDLVEDFRQEIDVYAKFASFILGKTVRKPRPHDSPTVAKYMKSRRQFGKVGILASGYGMGGTKCFEYMQTNPIVAPDLAPLIANGTITPAFATKLVKLYRKRFPKIPKFWTALEKAFRFVARYPGKTKELECGVKFWAKGSTVHMQLPSGRVMRYQNVKIDAKGNITWKWGYLWGGSICENLVQAAARDLIAENILKLDREGITTHLTVHDSIISVLLDLHVAEAKLIFEDVMSTPASWCPGLPLAVDIETADHYG